MEKLCHAILITKSSDIELFGEFLTHTYDCLKMHKDLHFFLGIKVEILIEIYNHRKDNAYFRI